MKRALFFLCILLTSSTVIAQSKYWIYFTDKGKDTLFNQNISKKALENRENLGLSSLQITDHPICHHYLDSLQQTGLKVLHKSRWLNAVSAVIEERRIPEIKNFHFVDSLVQVNQDLVLNSLNFTPNKVNLDYTLDQINAQTIIDMGLSGKGVSIGIIDGGFLAAPEDDALMHLFNNDKVIYTRDYINKDKINFFEGYETHLDWHGTSVWSMIGGVDSLEGIRYGLASEADFYLARTDHGSREFRGEEDLWIEAIEWMDSLGVRIINTSLGYSTDFDNPDEDYQPFEMDGKTSAIARAAQIAVDEKGMLIIVSAGNEGNDVGWQVLSTPADAEGVFSVGATNRNGLKATYSAIGPEFLPYVKPNIACYSLHGTSFSTPVITGLAACIMQYDSSLTNRDIMRIIEQSGNMYPLANNFIGYGVPDGNKIQKILVDRSYSSNVEYKIVKKNKLQIEDDQINDILVFHKKDKTHVVSQEHLVKTEEKHFLIRRKNDVTRSSILTPSKLIEIIWD